MEISSYIKQDEIDALFGDITGANDNDKSRRDVIMYHRVVYENVFVDRIDKHNGLWFKDLRRVVDIARGFINNQGFRKKHVYIEQSVLTITYEPNEVRRWSIKRVNLPTIKRN